MRGCGDKNCLCSTGIHQGLTFGKGKLDNYGYWQYPCYACARANDASQKKTRGQIAKKLTINGTGKKKVRTHIARSEWLWIKSWPFENQGQQ